MVTSRWMHSLVVPAHFRIDRRDHGVAANGVKRTRIRSGFCSTQVVLTAIFPPYQMIWGHLVPFFPRCPQKCPLISSGRAGSHWTLKTLLSTGFPGILAISRPHWTSPEVYGVGTAGRRTFSLSACFARNLISQALRMPSLLPRHNSGCSRTSLDIKHLLWELRDSLAALRKLLLPVPAETVKKPGLLGSRSDSQKTYRSDHLTSQRPIYLKRNHSVRAFNR